MTVASAVRYTAPALEKGLDILEMLSREEAGATQAEIARRLGRSVGEIFRMLVVLSDRGYVVQDPQSGRYALTTLLFEIAHRIPPVRRLTMLAGPLMKRLTQAINQSVHLAVLSGDAILVVGQVDSPGNHVTSVRLGARIDIWRASSGRVIMAFLAADDLAQLLRTVPRPEDVDIDRLRGELEQIRRLGHEVRDSFVMRGIVNISAPVLDHFGHAIAALSVPHVERYHDTVGFDECRRQVITMAAELSRAVGAAANPAPAACGASPERDRPVTGA